jgi:4-hydroxyphenylpyruvate dioxygenase
MIRSIAGISIGGTLDEKLRTIAAAGFEAVEPFERDFICFDGSARDLVGMCHELGSAQQPCRDIAGMLSGHVPRFRRIEEKFGLIQELGIDFLLVCSNVWPCWLGSIDPPAKTNVTNKRAK